MLSSNRRARSSLVPARLSALALTSLATLPARAQAAADAAVALPPRWFSGDTHVHTQACGAPLIPLAQIVQSQLAEAIHVACVAYWNPTKTYAGADEYFALFEPQITGAPDPASLPASNAILQLGVEVSGFNSSQYGHVCAIGIEDGDFPNLEFPGPDLEYFLRQEGAIAGYSHVRWPLGYQALSDAQLAHLVPAMLPVDAVLGNATFIEAVRWDPFDALDWRGAYYKLLNAGVRVSITAGTDNTCIYPTIGPMRTYVGTSSELIDFGRWVDGIRRGHTTISNDRSMFVDITAESCGSGEWLHVDSGQAIAPRVLVLTPSGDATSGTLELIYNGAVVASTALALPAGGSFVWQPNYAPSKSGWCAAHVRGVAHTAAIFVSVDHQPIASSADALYLREICERLIVPPSVFVAGPSGAKIASHCAKASAVYSALAAIEAPPLGTTRYGVSTEACDGPIAIGLDAVPLAGTSVGVTCVHAPASSAGVLLIGQDADLAAVKMHGADVYIDFAGTFFADASTANDGGYARLVYPLAAQLAGHTLHMQYAWWNPGACGSSELVASDALRVEIQ